MLLSRASPNGTGALLLPSSCAGLIPEDALYGYRKGQAFIRNSRHVPLPKDPAIDSMEALFTCIKEESHAGVRAVLGHFIFGLSILIWMEMGELDAF